MIYRIMCWLMGVCPKHWTPKMWQSTHPHSDDMELVCPRCEGEHGPVLTDKRPAC